MGITITAIAPSLLLTTRARVTEDLGTLPAADVAFVDRLIREASAAIVTYCGRPFARETVTETVPAYGDIHLMLSRTPLVEVTAVTFDSTVVPVTDYSIANRERGLLYRRRGWQWTDQVYPGLSAADPFGDGGMFMMGTPLPGQEEPLVSVDYTGGYVLPAQNLLSVSTVSAAAADNSFNDSGSGFPATLKSGDIIETSGFTAAVNNSRHVVTGTPTTAKIQVTTALTLELAGPGRTVLVQSLPEDVEKAALEAVKTWYAERRDNANVIEKQVGPMRVRLSESELAQNRGLPSICVGLLRPWVRSARAA